MRSRTALKKRGYSLLEMSVSLPLTTLLFVAIAASIGVARRSLPDSNSLPAQVLLGSAGMEQMAIDVRYATAITYRDSTELVLVVPDRNGDANPETISYQFPGASLKRQINGSSKESLGSGMAFNLEYETRLDAGTGFTHLRALRVSLTASGNAARYDGYFRALNEPVLP